jgi:N-acetylneuraminic acid mutarotase
MQKRKIESTQVRITVKRLTNYLNFKKKMYYWKTELSGASPTLKQWWNAVQKKYKKICQKYIPVQDSSL